MAYLAYIIVSSNEKRCPSNIKESMQVSPLSRGPVYRYPLKVPVHRSKLAYVSIEC